jgi:hypothetical protein
VERPAITIFDPEANEDTWGQRLIAQAFLTKSQDWSYEREWRMFLPLDDAEYPNDVRGRFHLFPYPPDAVTAVILGARCTNDTREKIETALRGGTWSFGKQGLALPGSRHNIDCGPTTRSAAAI